MPEQIKTPEDLKSIASASNIAEFLDEDVLHSIGEKVIDGYETDEAAMDDDIQSWDGIQDLAMQVMENKNFPWPNASNIKYPIITKACIQFGARIYPDIVETGNTAKYKVNGRDPEGIKEDRANRVREHTNWQLSDVIHNWEQDMDILLCLLPAYGVYYKKLYFSQIENRPVVEICNPRKVATSRDSHLIEEESRVSHLIELTRNEIIERIRAGLFLNEDLCESGDDEEDRIQEFVEQHRCLDLDNDGYDEPYAVTVHKTTQKVVRIVARFNEMDIDTTKLKGKEVVSKIRPFCHFVRYYFWPSFDGSPSYMGLGKILTPLNEAINTLSNQLIDSGTMNNLQSGFLGRGIRLSDGGPFRMMPGMWQPIEGRGGNVKDNVVPLPTKEPSQTLFSMLGMMIDTAKELSIAKDIDPEQLPHNTPAVSMLAAIEEGIKVYSSIYKRIYRSLKSELRKIFYLNAIYGDPEKYAIYLDDEMADFHADYNLRDMDISPAASPEISSDMQRVLRAQSLIGLLDSQGAMQSGLDPRAIMQNYLKATKQPNVEAILPPPPPPSDEPPYEQQVLEMQYELESAKIENQRLDIMRKIAETEGKVEAMKAKSIKDLAEAEAAEAGSQLEEYKTALDGLRYDLELADRLMAERQQAQAEKQAAQQPAQPQEGGMNAQAE